MRSQALDRASRRIVWLRLAGLSIVVILAGRAAHLTVAHTRARTLYDRQIQTEQRLAPSRGTIFDRHGRELAITTEAASIYALPRLMEDREATARALAEVLELDLTYVAQRITTREGFTYIARWVEAEQAERLRALALPGVGIDLEPRRSYPASRLAAPLLGFANIDGKGVRGIEQAENDFLTGQPRSVAVERDARGRALALQTTDPRDARGGDVALTLDATMQGAAEAALAEAVERTEALGGFVITMDPKNGDILALAEAPGFDPNAFRHLDYNETRPRTFADSVEAGSTMKAFLVATALDSGLITKDQAIDTEEGFIRVRGKTIRDRRPFGVLTPADVLRVSSNVGAVHIARLLGRERQHRGLERFGFGARTNARFPVESTGILRDWKKWQPVDQAAISYGQGISVTPIQLVTALAALANDGMRMEPRLVLAKRRTGESWRTAPVRKQARAVSPQAARLTLDMMQTVVSPEGTGRLAGLAGVRVAGKTGTAQKLDLELGRYSQDRYMAWFMGVVPADDPELAIVVAVDEPSGALHSGGGVGAPLFARVAAAQLARRGIVTEVQPIPAASPALRMAENEAGQAADSEVLSELLTEAALADVSAPPPTFERVIETPRAPIERSALSEARVLEKSQPQPTIRTLSELEAERVFGSVVEDITDRVDEGADEPEAPSLAAEIRIEPREAAVAAPPAGPAAREAAGPSAFDMVFVPDFEGASMARARRLAALDELEITTVGAIEGRVVSQSPVPGTVLDGGNRRVRLRFERSRTTAMRREETR